MKRLLVSLVLLAAAGLTGGALEEARRAAGASMSASRVPLGGFEPLGVGFFWMRAEEMRRSGRLVESVTNYRMVAELQPQVAPAFALPARLLVWTTSESGDPEQEWEWVAQGIAFLERGLLFSPDHPDLVFELGFTYYARLSVDPEMRAVAVRMLGRMPEELAVERFRRLESSETNDAFLADSARLLGDRRYEARDLSGSLAAYREALPFWARFAADPSSPEAVEVHAQVQARIRELEKWLRGK